MKNRAFLFTLDALLGLALLVSAFLAVGAFVHAGQAPDATRLAVLGRDFLAVNYRDGVSLSSAVFNQLTGHAVSEAPPGASVALAARAQLWQPPALCNCASFPCTLDAGNPAEAACLSEAETAQLALREAWVTP